MALCAARGRTRLGAAALAAGLVVHTGILWPYLPMSASAVAGSRPTLSVLAINLRFGLADLPELSAAVNRFDPDIVVATEVTTRTPRLSERTPGRGAFPTRRAGPDVTSTTPWPKATPAEPWCCRGTR